MGSVLRLLAFRVDAHERVGERLRVDGHLARVGIQTYHDGIGERREYRPPEEVFAEDALASFRGMPVTIQHPKAMVTPKNWRDLAVGHVGDEVRRADDGRHVEASLWLQDERAIRKVLGGELVELSVGYFASLDMSPGVSPEGERYDAVQREIRGNHVALLRAGQARGGPTVALRLDSRGHQIAESTGPDDREEEERVMKFLIRVDGRDYEIEAPDRAVADALAREREALEAKLGAAEKKAAELEAKLDAAKKAADETKRKLDAFEAEQTKARRAKLVEQAGRFGDVEITDADDELTIRRKALAAVKADVEGKTDAYIEARFDAELERLDAKKEESRNDAGDVRRGLRGHRNDGESDSVDMTLSSIDAAIRRLGR